MARLIDANGIERFAGTLLGATPDLAAVLAEGNSANQAALLGVSAIFVGPAGIAVSYITFDPSAGGGQPSELGSIALRQNGAAGELWVKTGLADTAWTKLTP